MDVLELSTAVIFAITFIGHFILTRFFIRRLVARYGLGDLSADAGTVSGAASRNLIAEQRQIMPTIMILKWSPLLLAVMLGLAYYYVFLLA